MTTNNIRTEIAKLRSLSSLYEKTFDDTRKIEGKEREVAKLKLKVTHEEMLKSNYKIGVQFKRIEEKI